VGAVPEVVVRTPVDLRVRHAGSVVPLPRAHVKGGIPPLACRAAEYMLPTEPARLASVEISAGIAGTVIVAVPLLVVSAIEVAVIVAVCELLVGAEAVKVAEVVVSFDIVPAPLAVNVVVSFPSTLLVAAETATLSAGALPPHPAMAPDNTAVNTPRTTNHQNLR
jgi:hypothetical protein